MKMKTFILLLFLVLSLPRDAIAQELSNKNQYLSLSLGQGYDDGIVSLTHLPTIGLGFEKELNRFFNKFQVIFILQITARFIFY